MTEETKAEIMAFWQRIKKVVYELITRIKAFIKKIIMDFVHYCLEYETLKSKARIYLQTKNRRIKRKQFKWLVKAVFGGRMA
ncbi:hypothetical protein M2277_005397 [Paenibacillus sp. LBL]|uniref:hypothetical protein n=1 Tax=Paenibacillus sp. LBL TaxID=2940563 RepID=UPI0024739D77|nr:hypothetical protein [Paenibacillus sp. LBL]MDH6674700.1 hypothetical protein [Paenibacillus sp. LBL]